MPKPPTPKTKVLFVDDDHGFLQMADEVFGQLGKDTWEIYRATDAQGALQTLRDISVDLVVLDLLMPGIGGMELLKILDRDFPNLQKVFLTGGTDDKARISGLENGADLFLEKPANLSGLESVFATLNQLARWHQKTGNRGSLRPAGLLDIIRMECASGNSRLLEVSFENVKGQIYIKAGVIVHAETEGRRGQSAFAFLASRSDAEFSLKQFVEPPERSVDRQWEFLVMEAFSRQEQTEKAGETRAKGSGSTTAPSVETPAKPAPALRPQKAVELVRPVAPSASPAPPPPQPPAPVISTSAPATAPVSTPRSAPAAPTPPPQAPPARALPVAAEAAPAAIQLGARVRPGETLVEETLVCSKQREVLYEAGITQSDSRLRLISFVSQESTRASQGLPAGNLERVELQASDGRIVVRFQESTDILIRSNTAERRSTGPASRPKPTVEKWLEAIMEAPGVLASGVVRPDLTVRNIPCYTDYTEEGLNKVWRWIGEFFRMLNQDRITAWQVRLIYEKSQVYCLKRLDRFVFSVFLTKDPQQLDAARVQEIFADFDNLGSL